MSDWLGTYSTSAAVNAGLDLEMPGPPLHRGLRLVEAVKKGEVSEETINTRVMKVLHLVQKSGKYDDPKEFPEFSNPNPNKALLRKSAVDGMVLLKNEMVILPIEKSAKIALIGAFGRDPVINGGGSAALNAQYKVSPLEAFKEYYPDCQYSFGFPIFRKLPELPLEQTMTASGQPGLDIEYINGESPDGPVIHRAHSTAFTQIMMETTVEGLLPNFIVRMKTAFTPLVSGNHTLSIISTGDATLTINDQTVCHYTPDKNRARSEVLFDAPSFEKRSEKRFTYPMVAGERYRITFTSHSNTEPDPDGLFPIQLWRLGYFPQFSYDEAMSSAVKVAQGSDVALVFAGTNEEWESEGWDRPTMDMPFQQNDLIAAIAKVTPTIVVLQCGAPVDISPWIDYVHGLLLAWFPGQECGNAILDIVNGTVCPSGKLPFSWPKHEKDNPTIGNFPITKGLDVKYEEDVFVGYRHYQKTGISTQFSFGFGLSFTKFEISNMKMEIGLGGYPIIVLDVANTGDCSGAEIVQIYVAPTTATDGPVKELKAFRKVFLEAGGKKAVGFPFDKRSFSHWDTDAAKWRVYAGKYEISVGSSVDDSQETVIFEVRNESLWRTS
jgi:beta-glucosidase